MGTLNQLIFTNSLTGNLWETLGFTMPASRGNHDQACTGYSKNLCPTEVMLEAWGYLHLRYLLWSDFEAEHGQTTCRSEFSEAIFAVSVTSIFMMIFAACFIGPHYLSLH